MALSASILTLIWRFSERLTAEVRVLLDELDTIFVFDVVHFENLRDKGLKQNIGVGGIALL